MKKGMSKFLSVMCSIVTLSGMLSMNPASAIMLSREEVYREISTASRCCREQPNMSILKAEDEIDIEKFKNVVIYKLINFIDRNLGGRSRDFIEQLVSRMDGGTINEQKVDQRLGFIYILTKILEEIVNGRSFALSEDVRKQFMFFHRNVLAMLCIIRDFSIKGHISKDAKITIIEEIIRIIREMDGQLNALNSDFIYYVSCLTSSFESPKLEKIIIASRIIHRAALRG